MYAYLRTVSGPDQGRIFDLADGTTLVIGRGEKSDTHLSDGAVARLHCELRCQGGEFRLVDLDSVGGTTVGGLRIQEHRLKHGEEIEVGHTRLKLFTSAGEGLGALGSTRAGASATAPRPEEPVLTGTAISHYTLGPLLARGRTGTIYRARSARDDKEVAVKVLHADLAHDEAALRRFMRVMKAAVGLHHPNWVALCGAGKHGETCWFAMEYVEGEPLTKVTERLGTRKMISWKYALSAGMQIARALGALHEKNIVHRNVAPENILIRSKDKVAKLGDPILAELRDGDEPAAAARPGELGGNIAYMAPERTRDDPEADIRADIYGLGATIYTMIVGKPPFEAPTLAELVAHIRRDDPVPPRRFQDSLPDEFQDVIERMLAKRPENRYPDPAQAVRALERVAKEQAALADPGRSAFIRLQNIPGDPHAAPGPRGTGR